MEIDEKILLASMIGTLCSSCSWKLCNSEKPFINCSFHGQEEEAVQLEALQKSFCNDFRPRDLNSVSDEIG